MSGGCCLELVDIGAFRESLLQFIVVRSAEVEFESGEVKNCSVLLQSGET